MLKKLALLLISGSLLAACSTEQNSSKPTLGQIAKAETKEATTRNTEQTVAETPVAQLTSPSPAEAAGEAAPITWNDFFDNGDQTKPSQQFESLGGKKIVFEGYMGELLSMDGGWFLLIEAPGAECPFCSTDQSYWNKIMIVFAKEPSHLRYIPGKVRVTGTLDVGEKTDESGYTTMFRIYHATFESAN